MFSGGIASANGNVIGRFSNGEIESNGVELSINGIPCQTKNLRWTVAVNFAWEDCHIKSLDSYAFIPIYPTNYQNCILIHKPRKRPHTFYMFRQVYDKNGNPLNGIYDGNQKYTTRKSSIPSTHIGVSTNLIYRNWDFSINGHGAFGHHIYNNLDAYHLRNTHCYQNNILEMNLKP